MLYLPHVWQVSLISKNNLPNCLKIRIRRNFFTANAFMPVKIIQINGYGGCSSSHTKLNMP